MYDDGQSLIAENDTWKADAAELQKQIEAVVNGVGKDEATNRLVDSVETLGDALAGAGKAGMYDLQSGLASLSVDGTGLYRDIVDVVIPRIIGLIKEIPVPRIEYKSQGEPY